MVGKGRGGFLPAATCIFLLRYCVRCARETVSLLDARREHMNTKEKARATRGKKRLFRDLRDATKGCVLRSIWSHTGVTTLGRCI